MRAVLIFVFVAMNQSLMAQEFFDQADLFLNQYVAEGLVKYEAIKKKRSDLSLLVDQIAKYPIKDATLIEKKAFYINAYNLLVIDQVISNYPIEGPLKIDGFFDKKEFKVGGEMLTLDQLEKERLMQMFPDPRLHLVLVCAAMGCPPLSKNAYRPEFLEKQITERINYVLNFQPFIRVNKGEVGLSRIFEWYESDFLSKSPSIPGYIDQFRTDKISGKSWYYYEYDWSLNSQ